MSDDESEAIQVLRQWKTAKARHDELMARKKAIEKLVNDVRELLWRSAEDIDTTGPVISIRKRGGVWVPSTVSRSDLDAFHGTELRTLWQELADASRDLKTLGDRRAALGLD